MATSVQNETWEQVDCQEEDPQRQTFAGTLAVAAAATCPTQRLLSFDMWSDRRQVFSRRARSLAAQVRHTLARCPPQSVCCIIPWRPRTMLRHPEWRRPFSAHTPLQALRTIAVGTPCLIATYLRVPPDRIGNAGMCVDKQCGWAHGPTALNARACADKLEL